MFVLGLILILVAVGLVLAAVLGGADDDAAFDLGSLEVSGLNVAVVFLVGALTLLLLVLGLGLLRVATRRAAVRRRESKKLDRLSAQLEQREAELRRERGDGRTAPTGTGADGSDESPSGGPSGRPPHDAPAGDAPPRGPSGD